MKTFFLAICFITILTPNAELCYSQSMPKYPFVQYKVCPFECCQFGKWVTHSPLNVYPEEGDTSSVSFRIIPVDSFTALTGNIHMIRPGVVVVIRDSIEGFHPGDTLYTLAYGGEGNYDIWAHGKFDYVEQFWHTDEMTDRTVAVLVSKPLMIWWVRIKCRNSREGWLRLINTATSGFGIDEEIDGMDGCG